MTILEEKVQVTETTPLVKRDFKQFRLQINNGRAPINDRVYKSGRYGYYRNNPVAEDFTLD